jgi:hypothetical protein
MRDSFVLFQEQEEVIKKLSDEQAGKLYKAIFVYNRTGEAPELDFMLELIFTPIKQQLDRSTEKWEKTCQKRSEAGIKSGESRRNKTNKCSEKGTKRTNVHFVEHNERDPDPDPELKEKINKKEKSFIKPSIEEIKKYCLVRKNDICPEAFFDFYESNGWIIGKNKMEDWQAAVRNWERNSTSKQADLQSYKTKGGLW